MLDSCFQNLSHWRPAAGLCVCLASKDYTCNDWQSTAFERIRNKFFSSEHSAGRAINQGEVMVVKDRFDEHCCN